MRAGNNFLMRKLHSILFSLILTMYSAGALRAEPVASVSPIEKSAVATTAMPSRMIGACYASYQTPYTFLTTGSDAQLQRLKTIGMDTVSLRVAWSQEAYNAWEIAPNFATASDEAIGHVVRECHRLRMKVMLSLMLDFADDNRGGKWRWWGELAPGENQPDAAGRVIDAAEGWRLWFASYGKFLQHYARLARDTDADMLCIGNEFISATTHEKEWRNLIAKTRQIFRGQLTYQAHGGTPYFEGEYKQIQFWDDLDFIAMNGYWKLTETPNPSSAKLEAALQEQRKAIQTWYAALPKSARKPILFTEVGYHSADGTAGHPWERNSLKAVSNPDLQARCFQAFIDTFQKEDWFAGIFWWVTCPPGEWGIDERGAGHPFLGKPAEKVIAQYAQKNHQ